MSKELKKQMQCGGHREIGFSSVKPFIPLDYLYQVSHVVTIINLPNYTDYPEGFCDKEAVPRGGGVGG